jgi:excisionase family DNA binding protein
MELLTTRDVARLLRVTPETVLRYWRSGELPGFRLQSNVLRFARADVDAFLAGRRVPPEGPCVTGRHDVGSRTPQGHERSA